MKIESLIALLVMGISCGTGLAFMTSELLERRKNWWFYLIYGITALVAATILILKMRAP